MKISFKLLLFMCAIQAPHELSASFNLRAPVPTEATPFLVGRPTLTMRDKCHTVCNNRYCDLPSCCQVCILPSIVVAVIMTLAYRVTDPHRIKECYRVEVTNCGSCTDTQFSSVRCPMVANGNLSTQAFSGKIKAELDPICGTSAQHQLYQTDCEEDFRVCVNDNLSGYKNYLQTHCASKSAQNLRTKFMKRSNNRKTPKK